MEIVIILAWVFTMTMVYIALKQSKKRFDHKCDLVALEPLNDSDIRKAINNLSSSNEESKLVPCSECGSPVYKGKAKKVIQSFYHEEELYYCNQHAPKYDRVDAYFGIGPTFYVNRMQVDKDGTPIGYKKIKDKNPKK
jgi:CMP-N-acetylneuraminic acid synthetase